MSDQIDQAKKALIESLLAASEAISAEGDTSLAKNNDLFTSRLKDHLERLGIELPEPDQDTEDEPEPESTTERQESD